MAKKINIDRKLERQFSSHKKERQSRELKIYFLIVCEGEKTEPNYFMHFHQKVKNFVYVKCEGGGINTIQVVEKAINLRDNSELKYDKVWAVFDKDDFPSECFNAAIQKAKSNGIDCAWSNEAFELWYLLHFQYRNAGMKRDPCSTSTICMFIA